MKVFSINYEHLMKLDAQPNWLTIKQTDISIFVNVTLSGQPLHCLWQFSKFVVIQPHSNRSHGLKSPCSVWREPWVKWWFLNWPLVSVCMHRCSSHVSLCLPCHTMLICALPLPYWLQDKAPALTVHECRTHWATCKNRE